MCSLCSAGRKKKGRSMTYLITFLEGLITFISPCLLPMLPVYVAYFAGGKGEQKGSPFWKALAFVLGFTVTFGVLGAFAGTVGGLLRRYQTEVNLVCGVMVVFFGLNFLGVIRLNIFRGTGGMGQSTEMGIFSTLLFGIVFGLGWTPCIGAFLGSALMTFQFIKSHYLVVNRVCGALLVAVGIVMMTGLMNQYLALVS